MDVKDRILDAAEQILSEKGIEQLSLRAVTGRADVNLAAVNYHFGSKDGLIKAVVHGRLHPINMRRMELLEQFEKESRGCPIPVEALLDAMLRPVVEAAFRPEKPLGLSKLIGRLFADPDIRSRAMLKEEMAETFSHFHGHFQRSLPGSASADLSWGIFFSFGCLAHSLVMGQVIEALSDGLCDPADGEKLLALIVKYAAAGLTAFGTNGALPGGEK
jgi:AcrR family transcriptional regulator